MSIELMNCKLITSADYCKLIDPQFVGQTRLDENDMYYVVVQCEGQLYKIHNKL